MTRLVKVELRKSIDTRAGRWLLVAIGAITLIAIALFLIFAEAENKNFRDLAFVAGTPQGFLLPILGILTVTSEWSQRTGLVTFTLEPRRMRVLGAKLIAVAILGLVALVLLYGLAAIATVIAAATGDGGSWADALDTIGSFSVLQFIGLFGGLAFGVILLNSAAAIVLSFVLPLVINIVLSIVPALEGAAPWIDVNTAGQPLFDDTATVDAEVWIQIAVSSLWWVWIPLAIGAWRILHTEVK
jgi:ABC-type transport system involved in multi-copper enzyme maturation permease subunit